MNMLMIFKKKNLKVSCSKLYERLFYLLSDARRRKMRGLVVMDKLYGSICVDKGFDMTSL